MFNSFRFFVVKIVKLIKLICGFYDPTEGTVLLNGEDIRKYNRRDYYRHFSAVFQEFSIFDTDFAENVAQHYEDIDADILKKAKNNVAKPKAFREEVVDFENRRSIENWVKYESLADDCLEAMKKMKTYTNYRVVMAVFSMEMNNAAKPLQILCDRGDIGLVKINGFTFYFKF
jgi:ABC-type branched-subunit amino acid transport system ATPase component